jgi:hypothetical protein
VIRKIQSQSYVALEPNLDATNDFNNIVSGYFDNKVMTDTCNSWFKPVKQHIINSPANEVDAEKYIPNQQRVAIAWPGSGHHRIDALKDPRWEDFEFKRAKGAERNRYEYFGDGNTAKETRFIAAKNDPKAVRWEGGGWQDGGSLVGGEETDVTGYLKEVGKIDLEVLHEHWSQ